MTNEELVAFMPNDEAIQIMHRRYPVHSTFIIDKMQTNSSSAGWFMAGYLFGRDHDLRKRGFEDVARLIGEGKFQKVYDA